MKTRNILLLATLVATALTGYTNDEDGEATETMADDTVEEKQYRYTSAPALTLNPGKKWVSVLWVDVEA